jgi:Xaa-Pro dipeptidase
LAIEKDLKAGLLPIGKNIDQAARSLIDRSGYKGKFLHTLGHSLGIKNDHGPYRLIAARNPEPLKINTGYTIEPGIYLAGRFGVRTEIDFYLDERLKVVVTTPKQDSILLI